MLIYALRRAQYPAYLFLTLLSPTLCDRRLFFLGDKNKPLKGARQSLTRSDIRGQTVSVISYPSLITAMANPSQLYLLADHIKLSLLERQRAISLNLEPSAQDGNISRSLESMREGIEATEAEAARLEAKGDPYALCV